jgi:hypothetical protein
VTAAAALLAAWVKYKTDRRQELRKGRRDLYARFQYACAQLWDSLFRVRDAEDQASASLGDAVKALDASWITWSKVWMEMSIAASDQVWRIAEPLFDEFRSAYFDRRPPSGAHEDSLRGVMRQDLGR